MVLAEALSRLRARPTLKLAVLARFKVALKTVSQASGLPHGGSGWLPEAAMSHAIAHDFET
ncbi:hypothetical protein IV54_GL000754 [Levilactobacillus paucivorans]|uniref:Uncharacterized protein n=1 Tax=Levilactobacillus paucivorans TaxID=616990 RepID=A0A0R2LTD8_9LACO|nr:hypothetical protein IV54_GL000754 [Levilactobacillus paucivorans]